MSIYAVSSENDNRSDDEIAEDETKKGVKKILDLGVFGITTTWAVIAYIWLYYCLMDGEIKAWEAWMTFVFFWILLGMAFIADRINAARMKKR